MLGKRVLVLLVAWSISRAHFQTLPVASVLPHILLAGGFQVFYALFPEWEVVSPPTPSSHLPRASSLRRCHHETYG